MKNKIIFILLLGGISCPVWALDVGDVSTFIYPDATVVAKTIKNPTDAARLIQVRVEPISSPMADGQLLKQDEHYVLVSPVQVVLPGHASYNIKFYYRGPKDDSERYYRISWNDESIQRMNLSPVHSSKMAVSSASAIINTLLIVAPRKNHFDYVYKNGVIKNSGNESFRTEIYGTCRQTKKYCHESVNLMPNSTVKINNIDMSKKESHLAIWHDGQYLSIR